MSAASISCDWSERLNLISLRMRHHGGRSGYHRLAEALPGTTIHVGRRPGLVQRSLAKAASPWIARSGSRWYHRADFLGELTVAERWLRGSGQIFHFLYGENLFRYAGHVNRLLPGRNRMIATYHAPGWRVRELIEDRRHIGSLDAVVVVARNQLEFFADLAGAERVHFVPHGIDTGFFRPAPRPVPRDGFTFLCVGHHLRDFSLLAEVARTLWHERRDARLVVVARPGSFGPLASMPNVACRSNLSDTELRASYQRADVLLLPLRDATANNALLEAMACGLPILTTDLPGVRDYASGDCALMLPRGGTGALVDAAIAACDGALALDAMASAAPRAAARFSWPRVADAMLQLYERVGAA